VPASTPLSLPPEGLAALEPALRQPTGFASSEARRHGGQQTPQREGNAHTRDTMVRPWFTTQRQGPRPRHTHPDAMAAVQATWRARLPRGLPAENPRPVRVFSQDARRGGWLTVRRRRLTVRGIQPVGPVPHVFAGFYGYGAVAPTPGECCLLAWPSRDADTGPRFLDACAQAFPDSLTILLLDNRGAHAAQRLTSPANVRLVFFPPSGPERRPRARGWRDLTDALAWPHGLRVDAPQDAVGQWLWAYDPPTRPARTGYAYVVDAIPALVS
jgi:hypothetical protein